MSTSQTKVLSSQLTMRQGMETIDVLGRAGLTPAHLTLLRSDKELSKMVADLIISKTTVLTEADRKLLSILKPDRFFGPADWMRFFGVDFLESSILPLPIAELKALLNSPCPFVEGKKIKDTHYLYCLPTSIDGSPLTIRQWQKTLKSRKKSLFGDCLTGDALFGRCEFFRLDTARFSWFLMFQGVVPDSELKNWEEQLQLKPKDYDVPKLVEVIPMYFLVLVKNDELCVNNIAYVRTADVDSGGDHMCVSDYSDGVSILSCSNYGRNSDVGLVLYRRLE